MMGNPKSDAPLVIIVKHGKDNCDELREALRKQNPELRVGTIDYVNIRCTMKTMLERDTPVVGIIHFNPTPYGHVDTIPSGVAHIFMHTAKQLAGPESNLRDPCFILFTDAKTGEIEHMKNPIAPISGISAKKILVVRPTDTKGINTIMTALREYDYDGPA